MSTNPTEIENLLLNRPLPDLLPADQDWIMPAYDGLSIANLPATIAAMLGTELPGALPTLPEGLWTDWQPGLRRIVLIVLDALGWQALQRMQAAGDAEVFSRLTGEASGQLVPLTSVFPSTTAAALVSLRTGQAPATHGWLAYELYLRELGVAANAIRLCPVWMAVDDLLVQWGLDLKRAIPSPAITEILSARHCSTHALLHQGLANSAFTKMLYQGVREIKVHFHASDFWTQLRHLLAANSSQSAFITAYWSGLDTIGHLYGHDTDAWEAEFRSVVRLLTDEFLTRLPAQAREGTLLLLTSDHGQIRVPYRRIVTAAEDPELHHHLLVPIMGESRAAFVYPRPGQADAIRTYLKARFEGDFTVLESAQALEVGLFGWPIADETRARVGELLVLPKGDRALQRARPRVSLESRHGGLSSQEMLVPLFGIRLEAIP